MAAALGGARHVVTIDVDRDAIVLARENFRVNGLDPADHAFASEDAFEILKRYKAQGRQFDLVVCDPPAFAKSQKAVEARAGGVRVAQPGRPARCSHPGDPRHRQLQRPGVARAVPGRREGGRLQDADVDLQLVEDRRQPPDHPVAPQFREGRYLKCAVYRRPRV